MINFSFKSLNEWDPSYVADLMDYGFDIDVQDKDDNTILIIASHNGCIEAVKALIDCGAELDYQNCDGDTALMCATRINSLELVQLLVASSADLNLANNSGDTALIMAIDNGNLEITKALCAAGADLDCQNKEGCTALMYAAEEGYVEIVKALVEANANLNLRDRKGNTALIVSADNTNLEILRVLAEAGAELNLRNNSRSTALSTCSLRNSLDGMRILIAKGAAMDRISRQHLLEDVITHEDIKQMIDIMHQKQVSSMCAVLKADTTPYKFLSETWIEELDLALDMRSSEIFASTVMLADGYLKFRTGHELSNASRFFKMLEKLPIELQMICANKATSSSADIINSKKIEIALRSMFSKYEQKIL